MLTSEEAKAVAHGALAALPTRMRARVKAVHVWAASDDEAELRVVILARPQAPSVETPPPPHIFTPEELHA